MYFMGTKSGGSSPEPGSNNVTGEIEFYCSDPFKYSVEEHEVSPTIDDDLTFVIDYEGTQEAYPKKIFFSFFGDRANQYPLNVGDTVRLSFDIDSHEFNGRWFTNINGWKAEKIDTTTAQQPAATAPQAVPGGAPMPPMPDFGGGDAADDLPF